MSRSGLAKKLQPAKKALKRFTKTLKSKLHDLNHSKAVRVIRTSTDRLLAYCSTRFFLPFKKRFIAKPRGGSRQHFHSRAETSGRGKAVAVEKVVPRKEDETGEKSVYSIEDAWREVVARSPHLRPVDERAEEFIYKFREEIKLQKEK
ncbi:hypothetical protein OIU84_021592 [Salix udensis]|uniref:Uncharacterized protein n=1 Tax=Salix udensis TaxID=889485 RepID=A0AAD6KVC7_9ROSI|nr:hypothetical protein OIU84_021592 [Salix udensis]